MSNEFDFNTAGEQRTFDVIPANTIVTLQMMINRGGAGHDGWLTQAADGASENLDCEFIVTDGQFAKRKLFQKFTLHGERPGHAEAGEISRNTLRAIIESQHVASAPMTKARSPTPRASSRAMAILTDCALSPGSAYGHPRTAMRRRTRF